MNRLLSFFLGMSADSGFTGRLARRLLGISALVAALTVVGCNTAGSGTTPPSAPNLSAAVSSAGKFSPNQQGATYSITVSNAAGAGATSGTVTVTDPPTGLTVTAISGTGWTCDLATLICTRSDALAGGQSYPPIVVTGNVGATATTVTIPLSIMGGGISGTVTVTPTPTLTVAPPVLSISKTHTGNFSQGQQNATYLVTVSNAASAGPTVGAVSVTDTVPPGLTLVSMAGTGWTCTAPTCTRSDALAAGQSYPAITATVNVAANAGTPQVNQVSVSGGGSATAPGQDSTIILGPAVPALSISKTHTGNFSQGQQNATYLVTVSNAAGAGPTVGTVTVTDTVPSGLTLVSMAGTGWTCTAPTCTRSDALAAGQSYPAITATVNVAANAGTPQVNQVSVSGGGSATAPGQDSTIILSPAPNPTPMISSIDPQAAIAGGPDLPITVTGSGYVSTSMLSFNGTPLTTTFGSATSLTATVTSTLIATAGTAQVGVTTPTPPPGGGTATHAFSILPAGKLAITSISPTTAPVSSCPFTLTVNGTGFIPVTNTTGSAVEVNGFGHQITTFVSPTQLTVPVCEGPGLKAITVANFPGPSAVSNAVGLNITPSNTDPNSRVYGEHAIFNQDLVYNLDANNLDEIETVVTVNLNGNGTANPPGGVGQCLATVSSASPTVPNFNQTPCTGFTYTVTPAGLFTATVTLSQSTSPLIVTGPLDSTGQAPLIVTSALTGHPLSGSGILIKADPVDTNAAAISGFNLTGFRGTYNGAPIVYAGAGQWVNGNAPNVTVDFAQPGTHTTSPGDLFSTVNNFSFNVTSATFDTTSTAIFNPTSSAMGPMLNIVTEFDDTDAITGPFSPTSPAPVGHDFTTDSTSKLVSRNSAQPQPQANTLLAASAVVTGAQLSGPYTARLQGVAGSGASSTNSVTLFQFVADGNGNITSGVLDQNNGGTITSSVNIAGSTYTPDVTTPARVTIHLNSNGATLIDNDFTAYVGAGGTGFIIAGTPANPSAQTAFGIIQTQIGGPFVAASLGAGCPVGSDDPVAPNTWSLAGTLDFTAGTSNFPGLFQVVQSGTVSSNLATTGTFTITDPNTGRFTGNLTGLPGTAGAVVGYVNGTNLFHFSLSTSANSSALLICTGN
jgi:uncharacterized repeat protein (TIGR01451 family)